MVKKNKCNDDSDVLINTARSNNGGGKRQPRAMIVPIVFIHLKKYLFIDSIQFFFLIVVVSILTTTKKINEKKYILQMNSNLNTMVKHEMENVCLYRLMYFVEKIQ